ncbi:MAG: hypothetical protein IJ809_01715 [Clostridia bacterium]|nr:hypothetical protein [Clostridia bacterium]
MKEAKVRKGVMFAILLVAVVAVIGGTYSRYISNATVNASIDIAKWSVALNGTDISTAPTTKQVQLSIANNGFVKEGTIAPGTAGTFDVVLDPTGSEVAIDYVINIDTANISGITNTASNIAITSAKYVIDGQAEQTASVNGESITINEDLSNVLAGNKVTMSVTLEWTDNMTDAADTENGVAGGIVTVPITVTASQHI